MLGKDSDYFFMKRKSGQNFIEIPRFLCFSIVRKWFFLHFYWFLMRDWQMDFTSSFPLRKNST